MAEQKVIRELTPKQREAIEKISATAVELGISETKLCERIGITGSALSQIRKGYYPGNWDNQFDKIYAYFENKEAASETYTEVEYAPTSISTLVYKTVRKDTIKSGVIPMRTLQGWKYGEREPAPYLVVMMAYIIFNAHE